MKSIESELVFFKSLMKMISKQFGSDVEIVLHDWSKGYEHSIVAIEGNLTGRKDGDCGSNLGLEVIRGTVDADTKVNYITKTKDGKALSSSTIYVKDENNNAIGALCINSDISRFLSLKDYCNSVIPEGLNTESTLEFFPNNILDLLSILIDESISSTGKNVSQMSKDDKLTVIKTLDNKGVFLITKSSTKVCEVLGISKFTLYKCLDEIRKHN